MSNQQAKPHPHAERVRAVLKVDFATDNNVARNSGKDTNVPTNVSGNVGSNVGSKLDYSTPNKYRDNPEVDEMGIVKGTSFAGAVVAGIACLLGLAGLLLGAIVAIFDNL